MISKTASFISTYTQKYQAAFFVIKLLVLFFIFDNFFLFLIGATIEGGIFYSPIMAEHLNFYQWYSGFLLNGGGLFARILGHEVSISGMYLYIQNGSGVFLGNSCIGFSILSFYLAFILAFPNRIKKRILYIIFGTSIIVILNMIRIGGLASIYTRFSSPQIRSIDHHLVFNVTVYITIFIIILFYTNTITTKKNQI
jgi:exosortase/archaeosortase family protein